LSGLILDAIKRYEVSAKNVAGRGQARSSTRVRCKSGACQAGPTIQPPRRVRLLGCNPI